MQLHLVDGTYELFRAFFARAPASRDPGGRDVSATVNLLRTLRALVEPGRVDGGASHVGVAFDTVIESFRNDLFSGYKTGLGLDPGLLSQFPLAERAARAMGMVVWPMMEFEADDALATAAARWSGDARVERIVLCSPDKDLAQCVRGTRVVLLDRMRKSILDEDGVRGKFGIGPGSIPSFLALVGDSADGIPGIPRWGEKSAAAVLAKFETLDRIPDDAKRWGLPVRGADALAASLASHREEAELYRTLATLRTDAPLPESLDDLEWRGVNRPLLEELCDELGQPELFARLSS